MVGYNIAVMRTRVLLLAALTRLALLLLCCSLAPMAVSKFTNGVHRLDFPFLMLPDLPPSPTPRVALTEDQIAAGHVLRAVDWFPVASTEDEPWHFLHGTSVVRRVTVSSTGVVLLHAETEPEDAVDRSLRPSRQPLLEEERDVSCLSNLVMSTMGQLVYGGGTDGGEVSVHRPGVYPLPDFTVSASASGPEGAGGRYLAVLSPSVGMSCEQHGCLSGETCSRVADDRGARLCV